MSDSTKTLYAWATHAAQATRFVGATPGIVAGYVTESDALAARANGDDGFEFEKLFRVTVEEIETPEPRWWRVEVRGGKKPEAMATSGNSKYAVITTADAGLVDLVARVLAIDAKSAITAARAAWADLAKQIGGEG